MGYHDRDEPPEPAPEAPETTPIAYLAYAALVRLIGLAVLLVGVWAGVKIVLEAWALYDDPRRIERFADAIESGSNIDGVIGNLTGGDAEGAAAAPTDGARSGGGFRLSYFAAWFVVLLLMFVIGSLAMAAITTGGQLALYELQIRRHSRAVIREVRKLRRTV